MNPSSFLFDSKLDKKQSVIKLSIESVQLVLINN